jgi:hypothetical protein
MTMFSGVGRRSQARCRSIVRSPNSINKKQVGHDSHLSGQWSPGPASYTHVTSALAQKSHMTGRGALGSRGTDSTTFEDAVGPACDVLPAMEGPRRRIPQAASMMHRGQPQGPRANSQETNMPWSFTTSDQSLDFPAVHPKVVHAKAPSRCTTTAAEQRVAVIEV